MLVFNQHIASTRENQIIKWYEEVFPVACAYIQKRGGSLEEAKELFQQTLLLYYEKLTNENFQPNVGDRAYIMGIFKNLWLKYKEGNRESDSIEGVDIQEEKEAGFLTQKLMTFLKSSGEKCMDLLQTFYYEKLNMKEVAERFGFRSERSATVQKYKCLEKLRNEVKEKSLSYEDFVD